jgi:signal transduction histidine kinase
MPRVLHIEDDPANRLLVRKLLGARGLEVIDAVDGLEGVRKALSERPDLILVDINIPHLDGYEVTLRLRGEHGLAGVPIVAITAEGDRETSLGVGCDGYFQKPIDARTFAQAVWGYLEGHRESQPSSESASRLRQQSHRIVQHLEEKVAELSAANAALREQDRARAAFYRNISHELATPMTPIVGYLKLLRDGELGPVPKAQERALNAMDGCVGKLRFLIDNLLDVSGLETGKMKMFHRDGDLAALLQRCLADVQTNVAARSQRIVAPLPRGPLAFRGDEGRLGRAVAQLLDNASKFTPEGGTLGVALARSGGFYDIVVADTGGGVPPERADRIFDAFYQVDGSPTREHGGVGVGLAIARKVAEGHGGTLELASVPVTFGGVTFDGAVFRLRVAQVSPPRDPSDSSDVSDRQP